VDSDAPIVQFVDRPGILDLGWGHPIAAALPVAEWSAATEAALRDFGWQMLTYGHASGPGPLLDWLTEHLLQTDAGRTRVAETFVTGGASHALDLVAALLVHPGDVVVVDSPTYHLALPILSGHGAEIVGAPADHCGIDPAATADLIATLQARGRRVPLLYIVPTFANPTGRNLPDDRREALVEMAGRSGVTIVEDDTYRELVYAETAPASLWSIAGGRPVVRIGSFAKTVAPGLRLGWLNAAPDVIDAIAQIGYVDSGGGVNHSVALTMATLGASGAYDVHLDRVRQLYAGHRDALVAALQVALPEIEIESPSGGWFLWLPLPADLDAGRLLPIAERSGVSFMEGTAFYKSAGGEDHIRLAFSHLGPSDLVEAAHRLAAAIQVCEAPE